MSFENLHAGEEDVQVGGDDLLDGVTVIQGKAAVQMTERDTRTPVDLLAIPYYAWDNREAGEMVVEEGDTSTQMFVVIAGELEVIKKGESGGDVRVAVLGPGDWFGEMSIIDVQPRSASVRAVARSSTTTRGSAPASRSRSAPGCCSTSSSGWRCTSPSVLSSSSAA